LFNDIMNPLHTSDIVVGMMGEVMTALRKELAVIEPVLSSFVLEPHSEWLIARAADKHNNDAGESVDEDEDDQQDEDDFDQDDDGGEIFSKNRQKNHKIVNLAITTNLDSFKSLAQLRLQRLLYRLHGVDPIWTLTQDLLDHKQYGIPIKALCDSILEQNDKHFAQNNNNNNNNNNDNNKNSRNNSINSLTLDQLMNHRSFVILTHGCGIGALQLLADVSRHGKVALEHGDDNYDFFNKKKDILKKNSQNEHSLPQSLQKNDFTSMFNEAIQQQQHHVSNKVFQKNIGNALYGYQTTSPPYLSTRDQIETLLFVSSHPKILQRTYFGWGPFF